MKAKSIELMTWPEVEEAFRSRPVLLIPLGAATKEHGLHLPLNNDRIMAERLAERVAERCEVLVTPTLHYGHYPAFLEYPGSASLSLETFRDTVIELCRSWAAQGAGAFYVLNTGHSTLRSLRPAREILASEGIQMEFSDFTAPEPVVDSLREQEGGTHADEIETSIMLELAPEIVRPGLARKDYTPGAGPLTRDPARTGAVYSPTGAYGDPTLANREKGARIVETRVSKVVLEVRALREKSGRNS